MAPRTAPAAERVNPAVGRHVWETRYRYVLDGEVREGSPDESWRRVARAVALAEGAERRLWEERFRGALSRLELLPGGRILAGAGTAHRVTLFNCFVMGPIEDSLDGIFAALKEGALTMQAGGGVGYDFSTLRPRGLPARRAGAIASGPVSFMEIWNAVCATLLSTGARRGAMMATLRCDHPDIEEFIDAKRRPGALRYFNLSVQVTEAFLEAVRRDEDWPLVFPTPGVAEEPAAEAVVRRWPGRTAPILCRTLRTVRARELWDRMVRSACETGEPGALFVDRINRWNNLYYRERISATNPCGEIPLPPYGACDLASLNLTRFVEAPFTPRARLDSGRLAASAALAVRLLDDVIDISRFPLPRQAAEARGSRRIGLGVTGLADALVLLGLPYDSPEGRAAAAEAVRTVRDAAYRASIALARERGSFPFLDRERYLEGRYVRTLPEDVRQGIAEHGIRNSHLLAIAPAGTISLLADGVSSGIEPIFAARYRRRILDLEGRPVAFEVVAPSWAAWAASRGPGAGPPPAFRTVADLAPADH
ncbi:MAG TPA: adenosylcobalamin-dependent ribonucleoside-diphosphate reductase, partial [Thermoanaerobaculia bacterium]|nr:adenosylcobalamin-dependent ribonucleoside-diphosphate reductase [Thermoanaerobaculia bacterium]